MQDRALLQGGAQGPVQAVLEVDVALPLHGVREQITEEGGVLVEQFVQRQFALGGDELIEADRAWRHGGPVAGGQSVIRVRTPAAYRLKDHRRSLSPPTSHCDKSWCAWQRIVLNPDPRSYSGGGLSEVK